MAVGNKFRLRLLGRGAAGAAVLSVTGTPVTAAQISTTADFTIRAANGTPPYVYAVSSGTLPTGQSINATTGAVTGTLSAAATFSAIVLKVTDNVGTVASLAPYTVVVSNPAQDFSVTVSPTTTGTIGTAITSYQATAVGAGGTVTWTFDTANGYTPPAGVTIDSSTGLVSGTPSALSDGTYRMRIKATTSAPAGTAYSTVYQMVVQPAAGALVYVLTAPLTNTTQLLPGVKTTGTTFSMHGISLYANTSKNPTHIGSQYYTVGAEAGAPHYETGAAAQLTPNYYPFRSGNTVNSIVRGGRIIGRFDYTENANEVDWNPSLGAFSSASAHSYNNGAAMLAQSDPSTSLTIERVRIHASWDGIRPNVHAGLTNVPWDNVYQAGLSHHYIRECWLSDIYDDGIEDDSCQSLTITDTMIDGCTSGISMTPGGTFDYSGTDTLTIDGLLLRTKIRKNSAVLGGGDVPATRAPDYNDCGAPFKINALCPPITLSNSIICFEFANTFRVSRWVTFWSKVTDGGGNKLIYTGGNTMPSSAYIGTVPGWITQQTGATATATWAAAKAAWIAAHPWVYKADTD